MSRPARRPVSGAAGAGSLEPARRRAGDAHVAGVIARPPLLFLGALVLGIAADRLLPRPFAVPGGDMVSWLGGGFMILVGVALAAAGIRNFIRAGTPVPTNRPTQAVVTTGIHGWTRNPIYLGMFLVYAGVAVAARSPWALVLLLPLAIAIRYGVVAREERYLEATFGTTYRAYTAAVRRWL